MDWFYEKNGEQCGPVSENELKALCESGAINPQNLVWCEGMADWVSYAAAFSAAKSVATAPTVAVPVAARSGRMPRVSSCSELRAQARAALSGMWGIAVLVVFLNGLIQQVGSMIPLIGVLAPIFIAGPFAVGYHAFMLGLVRSETVNVSTLFEGFQAWLKNVGLMLLTTLIIVGSGLIAALPGAVLAGYAMIQQPQQYEQDPIFAIGLMLAVLGAVLVGTYFWLRYVLVYFIANDEPNMRVVDILKRSRNLMRGQSSRYCWLMLSYTGWVILGALAFGIGLLWAFAYMGVGYAAFYQELVEAEE